MKRRQFSLSAASFGTVSALGLAIASPALAQGKPPKEGSDYIALEKRAATDAPAGKFEVIEFFWYNCPHCFAFEPAFETWKKNAPKDVVVRRVPVSFRDDFLPQQKLYYALEALGKTEELHPKVFRAIHADRVPLGTDAQIIEWAVKQGLDKKKFTDTFNSFAVVTQARRASQLQDAYKIEGVPAIGIAGRYYVDGTLAGSMDRALQITDYLLAGLRKSG
ncbi:MAG: thiol:disulfide interchange protein DsbA/DsbL [Burkholderiales bacterium]